MTLQQDSHRTITSGITASVTQTQGNGALTADVNQISVCATANNTVTLPAAGVGRKVTVINDGAENLQIFPALGDDLREGVNGARIIIPGQVIVFEAYDATNWQVLTDMDYPKRLVMPVASWVQPGWQASTSFTRTHAADILYFTPIFVSERTTYDRIAIDVNTSVAAGSVVRLGLYAADAITLLPAALLNDFGTVLVDSTGDKLITINLTLERGYYWSAHISDSTPQLVTFSVASTITCPIPGVNLSVGIQEPDAIIMEAVAQAGIAVGGLDDPAPVPTVGADASFAAVHYRVSP